MAERRIAFVAGATGALGAAICAELAAAGLTIAVHAHSNSAAAAAVASSVPGDHAVVSGELAADGSCSAPVQAALDRFGRIDVLVNAAHPRLERVAAVGDLPQEDLAEQLRGVTIHASLCRDVLPSMRANRWGRVVFVAGALMRRPARGFGAYGAAKAAAATLTRYVALEEGRHGVTANIVAPGRVVDPGAPEELSAEQAQLAEQLLARLALPSFPTSADVARAIRMLVEPSSSAITGQTIWVTGGEPIA